MDNLSIRGEILLAVTKHGLVVKDDITLQLTKAAFDIVRLSVKKCSLLGPLVVAALNIIEPKVLRLVGQ